jgi:hypothetical protein
MRADAMHRLTAAAADSGKEPYRVVRIDTDTDSVVPHTVWGTMRVPAYVIPNVRSVQNTQQLLVTVAYCSDAAMPAVQLCGHTLSTGVVVDVHTLLKY